MQKGIFYDGNKATKISLNDLPEDAWTTILGEDASAGTVALLYRAVPWLYRAIHLRAQGVASVPWVIMRGEQEVVSSKDPLTGKLQWFPDPAHHFYMAEAALSTAGAAYFFREQTSIKTVRSIRWMLPASIQEKYNEQNGALDYFLRSVGGEPKRLEIEEVIYHWLPDPFVEIGPGTAPAQAALRAAGVLDSVDVFSKQFFDRGAIKATILGVAGATPKTERDKIKAWWERAFSGIRQAWNTQVFNMDKLDVHTVGEGLDSLENTELTEEKREDISTAFGIPNSILFSNAANFATAQQDELNFYNQTIVPQATLQAKVWNEQLLEPLGFHLEFREQEMSIFQEDEEQRSLSVSNLVTAGFDLQTATEQLGYELTEEQQERMFAEEEEPEDEPEDETPEPVEVVAVPEPNGDQRAIDPTAEHLDKWLRKALKAQKKGKSPAVKFESDLIASGVAGAISGALEEAESEADIMNVFAWAGYP